jgi:hypothetical protein
MHRGEPIREAEDFYGTAVKLAARIAAEARVLRRSWSPRSFATWSRARESSRSRTRPYRAQWLVRDAPALGGPLETMTGRERETCADAVSVRIR